MELQTVSLQMPPQLFQQIQASVLSTKQTLEETILSIIQQAVSVPKEFVGIPLDIAEEMQQLAFLDKPHLWRAAQQVMPAEKRERMEHLLDKLHSEGLIESEQQEVALLQHYGHRIMMIRAEAAVLLKRQGVNIDALHPSASIDNQTVTQ